MLKSNKLVFFIKGLNLLIGPLRNTIFGNISIALYKEFYLILKSIKLVFIINVLILLIGSASKSDFW